MIDLASIDKRVVELKFNNAQFEKGVSTTLNTLQRLKSGLQFSKSKKSLNDLEKTGNKFNLKGVTKAISLVNKRFSTLGIIGTTALQEVTKSAMRAGSRIASAITNPIIEGGKNRAMNIEQAKFQFEGLGINIEKAMASALEAVQGTAYGLDEAARVASQFGASGMVAGKEMTKSLRAVSGVAAMTGSGYSEIGNIFVQVAGQGRLMGDQLMQLSGRGINAAATLAKQMGKTEKQVREMVTDGDISFKTFYTAMDNAFGAHAKDANKVFTGALANMRAALARIGAEVAGPGLVQFRDFFNALTPVIDNTKTALMPLIDSINHLVKSASKAAQIKLKNVKTEDLTNIGYALDNLFHAFGNIFAAIGSYISPFTNAIKKMIPKDATGRLVNLTASFYDFTEKLALSKDTGKTITSIFTSIFSIIGSGFSIVSKITKTFINWITKGLKPLKIEGSGILNIIDDILKAIDKGLVLSIGTATKSFKKFGEALDPVKSKLGKVKNAIVDFISGTKSGLSSTGNNVSNAFGTILSYGKKALDFLKKALSEIKNLFSGVSFTDLVDTGLLAGAIITIQRFYNTFGKGAGSFMKTLSASLDRISKSAAKALDAVRKTLEAYQKDIKATTILKIAAAVGILAASIYALGQLKVETIGPSLGAVSALLVEVIGALAIINKMDIDDKEILKASASMIMISVAVNKLATAMSKLSAFDNPRSMIAAAGAITIVIAALTGAMIGLTAALKKASFDNAGTELIKASIAMIVMSDAVSKLSKAIALLSSLKQEKLIQGGIAVGALLISLVAFTKVASGVKMEGLAAVIASISVSILLLQKAVKKLGEMDPEILNAGFTRLAIMLGGLTVVLRSLNGIKMEGIAGSILAIAAALNLLILPVIVLGNLKLGTLIQGGLGAAGVIAALATAMRLVPNNFTGAAGLAALAAGLALLVPQIIALGSMKVTDLIAGIVGMATALIVLANTTRLIAPLTPALLALAGAFTLFGAGIALVGGGIALLSLGLVTLAGSTAITTAAFMAFLATIPMIAVEISTVLTAIAALAPSIGRSLTTIGNTLINVLGSLGKTLVKNIVDILAQLAKSIGNKANTFVKMGVQILSALLKGIETIVPKVLSTGLNIIIKFIKVLTDKIPKLVSAGVDLLQAFLKGVQKNAPKVITNFLNIILTVLKTIAKNTKKFVSAGADIIINFLSGMRKKLPKIVTTGLRLVTDILKAVSKNIKDVVTAGIDVVIKFLDGVEEKLPEVIDKGFKLMISFINGMADGIRNNTEEVLKAIGNLMSSIVEGIIKAVKFAGPKLLKAGKKLIKNLPSAIAGAAKTIKTEGIKLVKKLALAILDKGADIVNAGKDLIKGFIKGIKKKVTGAVDAVKDVGKKVVGGIKDFLGIHSPSRVAKEIGEYFVEGFIQGLSKMDKSIKEVTDPVNSMIVGMDTAMIQGSKSIKKAVEEISKNMKYGTKVLNSYLKNFGTKSLNAIKNVKELKEETKKASKIITDYGKSLYKESDAYEEDTASLKKHKKELKALNAEREKAANDIEKATKQYSAAEYKRRTEEVKWEKILNDKKSTKKEKEEAKKRIEQIDKERQNDKKRLEEIKGYYSELGTAVKETNASIKEDQTNMANHTAEAFQSMAQSVKESMTSLVGLFDVSLRDLDGERDSIKNGLQSISDIFSVTWIKESDFIEPIKSAISSINDIFNTSLITESTNILEPIQNTFSSMVDLFSTSFATAADMTDPIKSTLQSWTDAFSVAYTKVTDLFTKFESDYEGTTNDIIENMRSQVEGVKEWKDNLALLASRGLSMDFLKTLEDLGPSSAGMIKRFTEMTDDELSEASSLFAESSALAAQSFVDGYKSQNDQIEQMGKDMLLLAEKGFNEALLEELANKGSGAQEFIKLYLAMTPEQVQSINDEYKRSLTLEDSVTNDILQSFGYAGVDSAQSFIDGFASKQEDLKKIGEDMLTLSGMGFDANILEMLANKGADARTYIDLFKGMTPDQVNQLNSYYQNNLSIQTETAQAIADSYGLAGIDSVQAYIDGIKDKNDEVEKLGKDLLELSKRGFDKAILESLSTKGEGAQSFIDLYMQMSDAQISELNREFARSFKVQNISSHDILESYGQAGIDSAQSFIDGFLKKQDEMTQVGSDMLELSRRGFESALLEEVAKQGEGAKEFIELFMTMTEPQITQLNAYYKRNLSLQDSTTEEIIKSYGVTGESAAQEFIDGFKSKNDSAEQMGKDIMTLAKLGFDQGILENLGNMGDGAQAFIDTFLNMTPEQIQELNEQYKRSLKIPEDVTNDILASYAYAGTEAGKAFLDNLVAYAKANGADSAAALADKFFKESEASGKLITEDINVNVISGTTDVIAQRRAEDTSTVTTTVEIKPSIDQSTVNSVTEGMSTIGQNIMTGLATGIDLKKLLVNRNLQGVIKSTIELARNELGIHSPSTVFKKIGKNLIEGFSVGIEKTSPMAEKSFTKLSDILVKDARHSITSIDEVLGKEIDTTIKPVLDLSNINNGLNALDATLSKRQALELSANISSSKRQLERDMSINNDSTNDKPVVNFTQNNYSPKSLSRVDIYRQTKNQLSQLRTVM